MVIIKWYIVRFGLYNIYFDEMLHNSTFPVTAVITVSYAGHPPIHGHIARDPPPLHLASSDATLTGSCASPLKTLITEKLQESCWFCKESKLFFYVDKETAMPQETRLPPNACYAATSTVRDISEQPRLPPRPLAGQPTIKQQ